MPLKTRKAFGEMIRAVIKDSRKMYRANFLWPHDTGSVEEAGYEFVNAGTEEYRKIWWKILLKRARSKK